MILRRVISPQKFWFIGDDTEEARIRLYEILEARRKLTVGGLDMEPLEVLIDLIRSDKHESIWGAPQVLKIYRHMNAPGLKVLWPDSRGQLTYLSRRLLH